MHAAFMHSRLDAFTAEWFDVSHWDLQVRSQNTSDRHQMQGRVIVLVVFLEASIW